MADTLVQRAAAGDARAQGQLGGLLLVGRGVPYQPQEGMRLIESAAAQNDPTALQLLAVLAALGVGRRQSWVDAVRLVERAAETGDAQAQAQLVVLGDPSRFDVEEWFGPVDGSQRFETPRVYTVTNFLPKAACAWIIDRSRSRLEAARVMNPEKGGATIEFNRSNTGTGFSVLDSDLVLELANARVAAASGLGRSQQEATNVLHYDPGQEFQPHFDFIDPAEPRLAHEVQQAGQRVLTALIYLNDDFEGGETDFPRLDWRFKGATGDALLFWNTSPTGALEQNSLHAGLPPTSGEKWIYSKWVRDRPLPLI